MLEDKIELHQVQFLHYRLVKDENFKNMKKAYNLY